MAAIFYGDVFVGVTLPLGVFFLLGCLLLGGIRRPAGRLVVPLLLLGGLGVVVGVQALTGQPPNGKADMVAYLPVAYAVLALVVLGGKGIPDDLLRKGIIGGGLITGLVMCGMFLFAGDDTYLVRSQFLVGKGTYADHLKKYGRTVPQPAPDAAVSPRTGEGTGTSPRAGGGGQRASVPRIQPDVTAEFAPPTDSASMQMYGVKSRARNALGFSNYIAAFLVFCFTVCLFTRRFLLAAVFVLLTCGTLSRFGFGFLALAALLWLMGRKPSGGAKLGLGTLVVVVCGLFLLVAAGDMIARYPPLASISARISYWQSGARVLMDSPLIGQPRSFIMAAHDYSVFWNPHNAVLWIGALFGLVGIGLCIAYYALVLRTACARAQTSDVWAGVYFGLVVLTAWSLVEPLSMSPAYELLFATCLALGRPAEEPALTMRAAYA
ncbi:hypothetical protein GCM10028796_51570 [Ramlibacter monticola]